MLSMSHESLCSAPMSLKPGPAASSEVLTMRYYAHLALALCGFEGASWYAQNEAGMGVLTLEERFLNITASELLLVTPSHNDLERRRTNDVREAVR